MSSWPDPDKPGYPVDPETNGWHWLENSKKLACPWMWFADLQEWGHVEGDLISSEFMSNAKYLGPALTPAEVEDIVHTIGMAAAEAMNKILAAIQIAEGETKH